MACAPSEARPGAGLERLQAVDLLLRGVEGGGGLVAGGVALAQVGIRLLLALHRAGAGLQQVLVAGVFLLREGQRGLGIGEVGPRRGDLRLLLDDRRGDAQDLRPVLLDLGLGLLELDPVGAVVEARDHVAGLDRLVVADPHLRDDAGDARRHRDLVGLEIGVVGDLEEAPDGPPVPAVGPGPAEREQRRAGAGRPAPGRAAAPGWTAAGTGAGTATR